MSDRHGIVCSGVSCLDLFILGTSPLLTRESLSLATGAQYRAGGATSNTGKALVRMGQYVEYMTVIGNDENGQILQNMWKQDGISLETVTYHESVGSSLSVLPVYTDGKRGVYFSIGTNGVTTIDNLFGENKKYLPLLKERLVFHYGYPPLTPMLQGDALANMLKEVYETGIFISLDTTPVTTPGELTNMLVPSLKYVHLFAPNIEEASQIAGNFEELNARAVSQGKDIEDVITLAELQSISRKLLSYGVAIVVLTMGKRGAYLCTGNIDAIKRVPEYFELGDSEANIASFIPTFDIPEAINTTGAGDTFTAGILTGLVNKQGSLTDIIKVAQAAAAIHVSTLEGIQSYSHVVEAAKTMNVRE